MLRLSDIVGQDAAVGRLRQAMARSRLPHALLFAGPPGVGKGTTADALAAALLCPESARDGRARDACGRCADCRMMESGTHPDFHRVYKELAAYHDDPDVRARKMQELSIDVIRSFLIAPSCGAPARGRGKVFVVEEAESMSRDAQNCLLKTLEEPPLGATIILLSSQAEELLPTTRSRCSPVRFGPLPREFVAGRLQAAGVEAGQAGFWAALAGGSVGEALRLAKGDLYETKRRLLEEIAAMDSGGESRLTETLNKVGERLTESAVREAKKELDVGLAKSLATRRAIGTVLQILSSAVTDALRLRCGDEDPGASPTPAADLVHADQPAEIAALARRFDAEQLADVLDQLSQYEQLLWRNANTKILWDNVVITLASAAPLRV